MATKKTGRPFNLREFPEELYWRVKQCAAHQHMTTKGYVISVLEEATERDSKLWTRRNEK